MGDLIIASLPKWAKIVRIHVSGDFFSRAYFEAWRLVATERPDVTFYSYTKSVAYLPPRAELPANFRVIVSDGTRADIAEARALGYPVATVVFSTETPLPIDRDDSHAIAGDHDFALLIHGTQPRGTAAASAVRELKRRK